MSKNETLPADKCIGRVVSALCVNCPPAVPILVSGETIDKDAAECFAYYGVKECCVII
ncbi:MAG: hypothetical protein IJS94_01040 [Clostridia bacterium]|nr:hypothetical protein [Clostridia bacterium]